MSSLLHVLNSPEKALKAFNALGVPHRRIEDWKYSDLRNAMDAEEIARLGKAGWVVEDAPKAAEIVDLSEHAVTLWLPDQFAELDAGPMVEAAAAFAANGLAIRVPAGMRAETPVRLDLRNQGHARLFVLLEESAELTLVETRDGTQSQNCAAQFVLSPGSKLTHVKMPVNGAQAVCIDTVVCAVAERAAYRGHFSGLGGKLSRTELRISLHGASAEARLSGVGVLDGTHADVTTQIDHVVGDTHSTQLFKYVAGGRSRAVYQGRITVEEGADGTDSRQTAKALLLDNQAEADLKPELIIFADDVKCAHGAAVGDLDADSLFYLRARGIPEAEARGMLMRAFLEDAVCEVENDAIRAEVWKAVEAALVHAGEAA